jgi:hypothetical protein
VLDHDLIRRMWAVPGCDQSGAVAGGAVTIKRLVVDVHTILSQSVRTAWAGWNRIELPR